MNFKDRDAILRAVREAGTLKFQNHTMIFPDYTREVQDLWHSYVEVKKKLRSLGLQYQLQFTARLWVIHQGTTQFDSPQEAWTWLTEERPLRRTIPLAQENRNPLRQASSGRPQRTRARSRRRRQSRAA